MLRCKENKELVLKYLTPDNINRIINNWYQMSQSEEYQTIRRIVIDNMKRLYYEYEHMIFLRVRRYTKEMLNRIGITIDEHNRMNVQRVDDTTLPLFERLLIQNIQRDVTDLETGNYTKPVSCMVML